MDAQTARLATLINRLLDLSRIESGRLTLECCEADLGALVAGVVEGLRQTHPDREIKLDVAGRAVASIDALRLEQVIVNLLDNAIKFSPADTVIEVKINKGGDETVEIVVRDHGVGIPSDQRERIFERFHQAHHDAAGGGLGLGLYITKQIVDLHGGLLAVDAPVDGGTRFTISLPVAGR
jgi:signal transduction histidine kinase